MSGDGIQVWENMGRLSLECVKRVASAFPRVVAGRAALDKLVGAENVELLYLGKDFVKSAVP